MSQADKDTIAAGYPDYVVVMQRKQARRIEAFAKCGIVVEKGGCLGILQMNAGNADKLLALLRKLPEE